MKRKRKERLPEPDPAEWQAQSLQRFQPLLDAEEFALLLKEISTPLQTAIRRNPLKSQPGAPEEWQQRYGWHLEPLAYCSEGYRVDESSSTFVPSQTLEHRMGHFYIQEAASMLPVELFHIDPSKKELCLDLAASPGGKTTHLIARGMDRSLVIANDSSAGRIPALRIVLQNWGAVNNMITQFPGEKYGQWFPETFDRVLLDAPCSMQGLRTAESHEVRPVTEKEIQGLAKRQISLLSSALQAVKVGGEVVYSTCTLVPDEDEAVIDAVLQRFAGKVDVTEVPVHAPGITQLDDRKLDNRVSHALRLWPHRLHTAGFFACLLIKKDSLDLPASNPPSRLFDRTGFARLEGKETQRICQSLNDQYSVHLDELLAEFDLELARRLERIYAFPARMLEEFESLPVQSAGLLVGEDSPEGFIPSHEWISRFFDHFTRRRIILPVDQVEAWMRGEDWMGKAENQGMAIIIDEQGRFLGRGKVLRDRVKNLLPRRLI